MKRDAKSPTLENAEWDFRKVPERDAKSPTLENAEWDFRKVPDDEVELCIYYEIAREARTESLFCIPEADVLLRIRDADAIAGFYESRNVWLWAKGFPDQPWQTLEAAEVARLRSLLTATLSSDELLIVHDRFDCSTFEGQPHWDVDVHQDEQPPRKYMMDCASELATFAVIRLDWHLSKRELKKRFDQLLEFVPCNGSSGGRRASFRDRLNGIMTLRVKRFCKTAESAIAFLDKKLGTTAPFSSTESFCRAERRAKKLLLTARKT